MTRPPPPAKELSRWPSRGLGVAAIGVILCLLAGRLDRESFLSAYLVAFCYWLSVSLGCLALAMIHGMTGGGWGNMVRRIMDAGYETIPLMALLFLPIGAATALIYPWTDMDYVAIHEALVRKSGYLNQTGFWGRAVVYFLIWIVLAAVIAQFSRPAPKIDELTRARRLQRVSGLGFMAYGFSFSLASVDWMMSLEPLWYSTMYPLIQIAGHGAAGFSFLIIVSYWLQQANPRLSVVTMDRLNDYGNLMLASVMFWAYCSFFQFLIVWSGNLPEETVWYLGRLQHGWGALALGLVVFHFVIPFSLLLSKAIKRDHGRLCLIAGLLLLMHYVDLYWTIMPAIGPTARTASLMNVVVFPLLTLLTVGAAWLSVFAWRLSSAAPDAAMILSEGRL
ncbi:hypothetical protein [Schlesneria paludicola]|uniref:hypothetical protein n=1 Tax=Schlesneria paludicola TaxID=360056 RepID=UPI00029A00A9|nr:hypothetical protein [Schlesneria paludicola]